MIPEPVIDAHHHIWRHAATPWLNGPAQPRIFGEYAPLRRDYLAADFKADVQPCGVVKSVYIQVNVEPGAEVEETRWVASQAAEHGFPHAVVGYADLAAPDVADTLDREAQACNLRGIRQQLHWHENPTWRFARRPDVMMSAQWRRGLREVARRGLVFDLQVFASQMADAASLARDFPEVTFVLLHAGMLESRSAEGVERWRMGLKALAACPNVLVKLSGLGTFDHACSLALWEPVVRQTLDAFGPGRCLYGSNYPIESLWTSYATLFSTMNACLSVLSPAERRAVLYDNAARVYGL